MLSQLDGGRLEGSPYAFKPRIFAEERTSRHPAPPRRGADRSICGAEETDAGKRPLGPARERILISSVPLPSSRSGPPGKKSFVGPRAGERFETHETFEQSSKGAPRLGYRQT
jgi:hypothetical protein